MSHNRDGNIVNVPHTRRIYIDLSINIADKAKARAHDLRLPTKRYLEALIERDCAKKSSTK